MNATGSLYVGDLANDVTEALLFEIFNQVGPVSSIRVCRDASSRMSLGYAYVNFHSVQDAERALDTLNFTPIKNRACRIMWSHRDPSIRKSNRSNVFIKNLSKDIDNKQLFDTFSTYGNILSCKVAMEGAQSKGYGFVHYETEKMAQDAIDKVNGMMISGKKVFVGLFEKRTDRGPAAQNFTNVYVKNIPLEWSEEKFRTSFQEFGTITSLNLPVDDEGKHKGFGFVNFGDHESASKAVDGAATVEVPDESKPLFADRFQKKTERSAMLTKKYEEQRREKSEKFKNLNLYVKNLDETVNQEKLRELFEPYGTLTSCTVMVDDKKVSKGFGFVCFEEAEDATKALNEMNGKMIGTKPLYVNRAQRKEDRRSMLEQQFQANMAGQRMQPMAPVFYAPPGQMPAQMMQPGLMYQQQMMGRRGFPQAAMRQGFPMYPQPMKQRGPRQGGPGGRGGRQPMGKQPRPQGPGGMPNVGQQYAYNPNMRNGPPQQPMHIPPVAMPVPPPQAMNSELTASMLASATPEMQKQMLGERLFPLIQQSQPELAAKITGMLLEMEVAEILTLLDSQSELQAKIQEAIDVLNAQTTEA